MIRSTCVLTLISRINHHCLILESFIFLSGSNQKRVSLTKFFLLLGYLHQRPRKIFAFSQKYYSLVSSFAICDLLTNPYSARMFFFFKINIVETAKRLLFYIEFNIFGFLPFLTEWFTFHCTLAY